MEYIYFVIFLLPFCYSFRQEITLFNGYNYTGDSITLRTKTPDFVAKAPTFAGNWKSYCFRGMWAFYVGKDYETTGGGVMLNWKDDLPCFNGSLSHERYNGSVRFLGPEDSAARSLSLYEFPQFAGDELVIDGPAYSNIRFSPKALVVTGATPWTLFSKENFIGAIGCVEPNSDGHGYLPNLNSSIKIASVLRGCDSRVTDNYIYAEELETVNVNLFSLSK